MAIGGSFVDNPRCHAASDSKWSNRHIDGYLQRGYLCQDQTITRIGPKLDAPPRRRSSTRRGNLFFPGSSIRTFISICRSWGHMPRRLIATASKAALVGGTTTLIEMICPSRSDEPLAAFELWKSKAEGKAPAISLFTWE